MLLIIGKVSSLCFISDMPIRDDRSLTLTRLLRIASEDYICRDRTPVLTRKEARPRLKDHSWIRFLGHRTYYSMDPPSLSWRRTWSPTGRRCLVPSPGVWPVPGWCRHGSPSRHSSSYCCFCRRSIRHAGNWHSWSTRAPRTGTWSWCSRWRAWARAHGCRRPGRVRLLRDPRVSESGATTAWSHSNLCSPVVPCRYLDKSLDDRMAGSSRILEDLVVYYVSSGRFIVMNEGSLINRNVFVLFPSKLHVLWIR